jgi:carbamoyltransferase
VTAVSYGLQEPSELQAVASRHFDRAVEAGERQRLDRAAELGLSIEHMRLLPHTTQHARLDTLRFAVARAGVDAGAAEAFVDHHQAHAGGAFFLTGEREALVVTLDGKGDDVSGTVSTGRGTALDRLLTLPTEDSFGHLYSAFTVACDLRPQRDEGKLQAMAASGRVDPRIRGWLEDRFRWDDEVGAFRGRLSDGMVLGPYPDRRPEQHNELVRRLIADAQLEDAAATVQDFLERSVCRFIRTQVERTGVHTVVVAGGVFANVSLNRRVAELEVVERLHVHPAMTDAGIALGAAVTLAARHGIAAAPLSSAALGPDYDDDVAAAAFHAAGYQVGHPGRPAEHVLAEALAAGQVVARFAGRAEYGPRALGQRSIFAPATDPEIPARLNHLLHRSTVMPFAPMARRADAERWFCADPALDAPLSFMTAAVRVTREARTRYPAIVHSDGTARPQLVGPGPLEDMLSELERRSGASVVVNTSFNLHDEPMVCTPQDAARSAKTAGIQIVQVGQLVARAG